MTCTRCQRPAKGDRLPHQWKRTGEATYCPACLQQQYLIRTIALPVVEPIDATWADFRAALTEAWAQVTAAANWMVTELYARDIQRQGQARMPPMPRVYLYPEARRLFPGLAPLTVASLEHTTQAVYRAARYHVIWTRTRSLPTYRYPMPLPLHTQLWRPTRVHKRPVVRVRIGDHWWALRLKGGPRCHRQVTAYAQILAGEAIAGELALYRRRAHDGPLVARPNGMQRTAYTVACKMVAWLPRTSQDVLGPAVGLLRVQTGPDALLVALDPQDGRWRYHGDQIRRWSAEFRKTRQHFAQDQHEAHGSTPAFADRRTAMALKYQRRMQSAVREATAHLIAYARRRRCGRLQYDDSVRTFCPEFPFAALREWLRTQCDRAGIAFESATETPVGTAEEPVFSIS
jgi:hypothetical protein